MANNTGTWLAEQLMRDFGLTPGAAAGFAGNLAHESGNFRTLQEISPTVKGSRGGFGWAQWTGPRRRAFESFSTQHGLDPSSPEANYGFLKHELTDTPEGGVLGALQGVDDPARAAQIVSNKFLRPGIPHMESRINKARSISEQIAGNQSGPISVEPGAAAPALPSPINVADRPITPVQTQTAPSAPPPGILAGLMGGGQGASQGGDMSGILQMLMASQDQQPQPMQLQPMRPAAQQGQPGLSEYIQSFLQSRIA